MMKSRFLSTGLQKFVLVALLAIGVIGVSAAYDKYPGMRELSGQFDIAGRTAVDPRPNEPKNSHLRLYLVGDAAKALYENMDVDPEPARCGDSEDMTKYIGSTTCSISTDGGEYQCWLAIDIANQEVDGGWAC